MVQVTPVMRTLASSA